MEMPGRPADPSRPFPAALKIQQPESVKIPDRITVGGSGLRPDEVDPITRTPSWRVPLSELAGEDVFDGIDEEEKDVYAGVSA